MRMNEESERTRLRLAARAATLITPMITSAVVRAVHGAPDLRRARLSRAIVHARLLLDELNSAKLEIETLQRKDNAA
jgi:hypothetical protein